MYVSGVLISVSKGYFEQLVKFCLSQLEFTSNQAADFATCFKIKAKLVAS